MNKRTKRKKAKQEFIRVFSKHDWKFYNRYPRLFGTHFTYKDFTMSDLNRWYSKFICNKEIFENIIKVLHVRAHFNKDEYDFENDYPNLEKYKFKYLMDNIEELRKYEPMPKRIEEYLYHYLKDIKKNCKPLKEVLNDLSKQWQKLL